jgi:hypothetical protein
MWRKVTRALRFIKTTPIRQQKSNASIIFSLTKSNVSIIFLPVRAKHFRGTLMKSYRCEICRRQLTNDESIARGCGPDCAGKRATFLASAGTSDTELTALEAAGDGAARWVRNFHTEMGRGRAAAAKSCIQAARRDVAHKEASALGLKDAAYFEYINRRAAGENPAALRAEAAEIAPAAKRGAATRRRMRAAAKLLAAQTAQIERATVDCLTEAIQRAALTDAINTEWDAKIIIAGRARPLRTFRAAQLAA